MSEIEWRRRWKPGFQAQTWAPLELEVQGETYLFKSHFDDTNSSYEILISDYETIWYESIEGEKLKKRSKRLNPNVEAPVSKLLEHIKEQLEEMPRGTTLSVNIQAGDEDSRLQLNLTSKLAGLPYHWQFNATQAHKEMVAEHITLPVLTMVSEYQRRQEELFKALRAKDKEIEDLRAQGVKSSRRHLETGAFDETVFFNNMDTSKEFEDRVRRMGSEAFSNGGQNLYKTVMAKRAWLLHTPEEDAEGESLMDESSVPSGGPTVGQSWANRIPPSVGQSTTVTQSPKKSPVKSPVKSPAKANPTPEPSPAKDTELLRRQALERRLQDEESKKDQKPKKKKKIKF